MTDTPKKFHLGLCLAGAVTAGAYTAGVLDYLFETLELWQIQKDANAKFSNPDEFPFPDTPNYDVVIDVVTGSSAGGMCAAISTAMLAEGLHAEGLSNRKSKLYKTWVDLADDNQQDTIHKMLQTDDIKKEGLVSLLNTDIISELAIEALQTMEHEKLPSYVDPNLDVVFTISNLRGKRYGIEFKSHEGVKQHKMTLHQDYMRFKLNAKSTVNSDFLNLSFRKFEDVNLLRQSAIATGAFPIGLRPQSLIRPSHYYNNMTNNFLKLDLLNHQNLSLAELNKTETTYNSLNVDGGVFDNEPFGKAQRILNQKAGKRIDQDLEAEKTNRAILMIDPFPSPVEKKEYEEKPKIIDIIPQVIKALRSQSSFKKNDLIDSLSKENHTKFMIFPRKLDVEEPLCCASLGAFGGFLHKEFRLHDYQLGRRNAQKFLRSHFVIPYDQKENKINPILRGWNTEDKNEDGSLKTSLPIIPDYHASEEPLPILNNKYPLSKLKALEKPVDIPAMLTP